MKGMIGMTREKKEIIKKIIEIDEFIEVDTELGCGFSPEGAYSELEQMTYELQKKLAKLSHYNSVEDMMYETKNPYSTYFEEQELPFI